ncbi:phosphatidylinositol glycan, class W [Nematocida sp. ERTm5]|nr:phosphatidylinositol glycan, class W [Nematocida sp. ERTm5]
MMADLAATLYSRTELLHSTSSSVYWLVILDYFQIKSFWVLLCGLSIIHYIITISSTPVFGQVLCATSVTLFFLKAKKEKTFQANKIDTETPQLVINGLRYIVCSLVCISIFACDFSIYPLHKYKSKYFGISLMDFGVVAFMVNAGILSSLSHRFRLKKSLYMICMGLVRLCVILSGYHTDPTEYGLHLNFYFVYLLSENVSLIFKHVNPMIASGLILALHEMAISRKSVVEYVFFGARDNLFSANKEGLISIMPYTAVLLLGKGVGNILLKKNQTNLSKLLKLVAVYTSLHIIHLLFIPVLEPSRRLCSISFISFCCAAIVFPMCLLYGLGCVYTVSSIEFISGLSRLMNPLFLLSNLYVLIGNLIFDWQKCSRMQSHMCNIVYLFLTFGLPVYLYKKHTALVEKKKVK